MQINQELSTATTFILIAFIFSIISIVLFLIAAIIEGISISYINSVYASYGMKPPLMTGVYAAMIYGFLWMTIKGFNLTFAIIIPLYLDKYSLAIIGIAMSIFG